jgi:hypothetical protein
MKILQLIDTFEYVLNNSWQHQFYKALGEQIDSRLVLTLADINSCPKLNLESYDVILSTLKLRTIFKHLDVVKNLVKDLPICIYDQDPWESFIDHGSYKGAYSVLNNTLNVKTFMNCSQFWCDLVTNKGFKTTLVKMWPLAEYCSNDPKWSSRKINIGYMGQLHPYRKRFVESISKLGFDVTIVKSSTYSDFQSNLSSMKFYLHAEDDQQWFVDGEPIVNSCSWYKETEVLSRGCFPIRKWDADIKICDDIAGGILSFKDIAEVPDLINERIKNPDKYDLIQKLSVENVKSFLAWSDAIKAMQ